MKVVILCGGYGTRIRDVSENIPKPMITIGPYPILWHIMKYYASYGHRDFVLCLGYKANVIKDFFLNYESHTKDFTINLGRRSEITFHNNHNEENWKVTLVDTGLDSMTGARVKRIKEYVDGEDFMLTYGDGVGNIDLNALVNHHREHERILTVTGVRPPSRFGELVYADGAVTEFNEKPQAAGGRISGGFFVATSRIFEYLGDSDRLVFEHEPIQRLVGDKQLMVYEHNGFWQPMDTSREYQLLNSLYDEGRAPWVRW
ncbi:glucose-1-phosphate cytidylyltransferase [Candidatus Methylopumilus universalis]|uniref:Glucose-1-phosphate cytidylyltransferase n=2 Tax=Candidatus Methylopumilus universalis TaxID=2588536 RepID=A0ABX5VV92_9PROT|nr:glucose-1-phosphate cytidylyltransferase [Candidatus Methylopumilus universalis]QDC61883.1 glucose-1-phosphate cytidylyltransferase [Candidatus Methylopumilus universalis]